MDEVSWGLSIKLTKFGKNTKAKLKRGQRLRWSDPGESTEAISIMGSIEIQD